MSFKKVSVDTWGQGYQITSFELKSIRQIDYRFILKFETI